MNASHKEAQEAQKSLRTHLCLLCFFVAVLLCLIAPLAPGQVRRQRTVSDDPALEQRLNKLSQELRCLVCQNETLADSRADLAEDLRDEIRVQMKAGKSDKEIIAFLTERYGQFILYRPQVTPTTYLLWFGPFVLLLAGLAVLFRYIKQRRDTIAEQPLSSDERRRAEELLRTGSGKETA
ncbi:MAG TPA: cytochrome c-type biogenesis protein [Pyrinomonadaceae bacterium]|nr:cytochrome c-type biogenesis protein [Pyrinomonadaceae bacterium]